MWLITAEFADIIVNVFRPEEPSQQLRSANSSQCELSLQCWDYTLTRTGIIVQA
jgi:hypothetical protein